MYVVRVKVSEHFFIKRFKQYGFYINGSNTNLIQNRTVADTVYINHQSFDKVCYCLFDVREWGTGNSIRHTLMSYLMV